VQSTQGGQAIHFNATTAYKLWKGLWIGPNAYHLKQITDGRADAVALPSSPEKVAAIGPGMVWNSGGWFFYANAYQEFGAENRATGHKLVLRIEKTFTWPADKEPTAFSRGRKFCGPANRMPGARAAAARKILLRCILGSSTYLSTMSHRIDLVSSNRVSQSTHCLPIGCRRAPKISQRTSVYWTRGDADERFVECSNRVRV
jgi:Putative MetA-pathway of phenol degradation